MTREELKAHCQRQIESCEMWAKHKGEEPHGKVYEEHKLILELLEQESKTGHWINTANPRMSDNIVCSECGYDSIAGFKFCPNCGAKMESEEE